MLEAAYQSDISSALRDHERVSNRGQRHRVAGDAEGDRDFFTRALDLQLHRAAAIAADVFGNLFTGPVARIFTVNFKNAIAVTQARPRRRRSVHHRLNVNAVIVTQNLDTYAVEARRL